MTARDLQYLFTGYKLRCETEATLQAAIARCLEENHVAFKREVRLTDQDRVDFMVGGTAIEVKIDGGLSELTRQVHRYAQHSDVAEILVITTKAKHAGLPRLINNKPLRLWWIGGQTL